MSLRKPNKRILILCEGVTEQLYATSLRFDLPRSQQRSISVDIVKGGEQNPLHLFKEAMAKRKKAQKEKNPYDSIWLFFDHDNWPQLQEALHKMEKEGFKLAYTALCLEHWFILHYQDCGRAFQKGEEVVGHLKKFWTNYHKTKLNHYALLRDMMEEAMERANRINLRQQEVPLFQRNPYCTIPDLIAYFRSLEK
jgi:hypothetical protein